VKIEVHMRDGRTAFRFPKRSVLKRVLGNRNHQDAVHKGPRVMAEIRHHADDPWIPASVRSINPNSISFVLEVPPEQSVSGGVEEAAPVTS
jgi:hypothetical protein